MKGIIILLVFVCYWINLEGQESPMHGTISAKIINQSAKPVENTKSSDPNLNSIFKEYDVYSYRLSFPHSKYTQLQSIVEIQCNCNAQELSDKIKSQANNVLTDLRIFEEPTPDIDPPSDYLYQLTLQEPDQWLWHLINIVAQGAWDITTGSSNVIIASIDTDFDITHPDLENKIIPNYDPLTLNTHSAIGDSHGTFTISFAGAETNGGGQLASIGFNTRLIAYRKESYPLEEAHHASFDMGADVITYSFSGVLGPNEDDSLAVKEILDNGTIIVRSAGNHQSDSDNTRFPFASQYDERIIIVTSTDNMDNHTSPDPSDETDGNYPEVDICAPGYCVMGAVPTRTYDSLGNIVPNPWPYYGCSNGTSNAAPIVAGVCALMKSVNPTLTPAQVQDIIKKTADPVADAYLYPGLVGAGRINAHCAVYYSEPLNLTGTVGGTYRGYFINVENAQAYRYINLLGAEITIEGPFVCDVGYELTIQNPDSYLCPH